MNCKNCLNLLRNLVENKLDPPSAERVNAHLVACQSCEAQFEAYFNEQGLYKSFLSEIEPPADLPAKFQTMLEAEEYKASAATETSFGFYERLSTAFAFIRLNTALTIASMLMLFALSFALFVFIREPKGTQNNQSSLAVLENLQSDSPKTKDGETGKNIPAAAPAEVKKSEAAGLKKDVKKELPRAIPANQAAFKKVKSNREVSPETVKLSSEDQNQIAQIQALEIDVARQIEKVEILFRAFRNARAVEDNGQYDIAYEKQQARKLLQINAALKQRAESYGNFLTGEMLKEIESYLLDIANLDSSPSAEQVAKIKTRFKNQNIITNLQGF